MPISVFRGKGISDGVQTEWNLRQRDFLEEYDPGDLESMSEDPRGGHEIGGRAPCLVGPSSTSQPTCFAYIFPYTLKPSKNKDRSGVPPPQASVATKNQSRPCFGTLPEGGSLTGGHLHHPGGLHDEEGVVHPRGWGYVPVAMCLISLSRVLSRVPSIARSWCIPSFAIVVGSYDVSPPLLSCDELSFPFEVILSDWIFYKNTWCMSCMCLSVVTMGYHVIHLMYVLVINLRVQWTYA